MSWTVQGSIKGPKGDKGDTGTAGAKGDTGDPGTTTWSGITDKPTTFPPSEHTHNASDINAGKLAIARIPTGNTGSTVCVGNDARLSNERVPVNLSVTNAKIAEQAVGNAEILNSAAIALSKLATGNVSGSKNGNVTTMTVWQGTAAQYAATAKDANTVYVVT